MGEKASRPIADKIRFEITKALDWVEAPHNECDPVHVILAKSFRDNPVATLNAMVRWAEVGGVAGKQIKQYNTQINLGDDSKGRKALQDILDSLEALPPVE